jgi:hypothetical protein
VGPRELFAFREEEISRSPFCGEMLDWEVPALRLIREIFAEIWSLEIFGGKRIHGDSSREIEEGEET